MEEKMTQQKDGNQMDVIDSESAGRVRSDAPIVVRALLFAVGCYCTTVPAGIQGLHSHVPPSGAVSTAFWLRPSTA